MANAIIYSAVFIKKAKVYKKKYLSLVEDLYELEEKLLENPQLGNDLGAGLYKIRLAIKSKGKGKSGGFRVITYLVANISTGTVINMLTLYDKSEESSIDKKELPKINKSIINCDQPQFKIQLHESFSNSQFINWIRNYKNW